MSLVSVRNIRASGWVSIIVIALIALAMSVGDADARRKRKRVVRPALPPLAHIVVDAKTGKVLAAHHADGKRYPASLTKVMTLYMLFERLQSGRLSLHSRLKVSRHAATRPPSKLGLRPGSTITVENAIKAMVTKSANDVAVVVAEALGGSESAFARQMTLKARALGMNRTTYMNASGLPNSHQVTTARDQATLGRAIQRRFPRYYRYFSTHTFRYHGRRMRNHNHLLGMVRGVDGIKTGYTHASGYNLVSSVHRNRRHIVAVVLGGRTSRGRDRLMMRLISKNIAEASPRRTAFVGVVAEGDSDGEDLPVPVARPSATADAPGRAAEDAEGSSSQAQNPIVAEVSYKVAAVGPVVAPTPAESASETPVLLETQVAELATPVKAIPVRAAERPGTERVKAAAASQSRELPNWLRYLLVAFIGAAGSFLTSAWRVLPRRASRRWAA